MNDIEDLNDYVIIMIYPDGTIEKIVRDSRNFHMEYMVSLINSSNRLKDIIKKRNIYIPTDETEIKYTLTYDLDTQLAREGIIVLHNLLLDFDMDEIDDWDKNFHVTLPGKLSSEQEEILRKIINDYDMTNSWFGILEDNELIDIEYRDLMELINNKKK